MNRSNTRILGVLRKVFLDERSARIEWTIPDFKDIPPGLYSTPTFHCFDTDWYLEMDKLYEVLGTLWLHKAPSPEPVSFTIRWTRQDGQEAVVVRDQTFPEGSEQCQIRVYAYGRGSLSCTLRKGDEPGVSLEKETEVASCSDGRKVCDARKVRATGRGLQQTGVRVKDVADFKIFTENAGNGQLDVKVIGPGGVQEKLDIRRIDEHTYDCAYCPQKEGRYIVTLSYGGLEIFKSPYEVNVGPYKESKIMAYGPGLDGGIVGYPACFTAETNGETGALGFSIEGPIPTQIDCKDNGDGSVDVQYLPTAPGEYAIHVLCYKEDIPNSPYMAQILPRTHYHPEKHQKDIHPS